MNIVEGMLVEPILGSWFVKDFVEAYIDDPQPLRAFKDGANMVYKWAFNCPRTLVNHEWGQDRIFKWLSGFVKPYTRNYDVELII